MHSLIFVQTTCKLYMAFIFFIVTSASLFGQGKGVQMGPVVVADGALALKTELTPENVKLENWPVEIIPADAITSLKEVTDMVTLAKLTEGMPITRIAIRHKNATAFPPDIPRNMKVVAFRVSNDDTIQGLLRPGNRVDVIGVTKRRDRDTSLIKAYSQTFLKGIQVYSINRKPRAGSIVGLLVTETQSEALVFVQNNGSLKFVLRDDDVTNDGGVGSLDDFRKIVEGKDVDVFNELRDLRALVDDQQRVIREFRKRLERLENEE